MKETPSSKREKKPPLAPHANPARMPYARGRDFLWNLQRFGIQPGLERMEALMVALGHPEVAFPVVHIAGTNGKGSTAAMVERVLRQAGYKTGLYTSPHMVDLRERIQINGEYVSEAELEDLIAKVRESDERENIGVTFFEFVTALGLLHFAQQEVDMAVVEVGMGGLLDATNVVRPEVAVVTNVGLDHTEFLGETVEEIAREKAGVFKKGAVAMTGARKEKVLHILEERVKEVGVDLLRAQDFFDVRIVEGGLTEQVVGIFERNPLPLPLMQGGEQTPSTSPLFKGEVRMKLVGEHQAENLQVALSVLWNLREKGWNIAWRDIEQGIAAAFWPGRLQVVGREPLVLLDAAHNEDGVEALGEFLGTVFKELPPPAPPVPGGETVLLIGVKKGRDVQPLAEKIAARFSHVVVSQAEYMPEDPEVAAAVLRAHGIDEVEVVPERTKAVARAREITGAQGMILVTGSIYFVGDVLKEMQA